MPRRRTLLAALSLALMTAGPAPAQEGSGALAAGSKALSDGQYSAAVTSFTKALGDTKLTEADAAKALYQRGVALRMLGQQSRAIADLSQAIWLGGLPGGERMRAHVHRGLAYRATGLGAQADADFAAARKLDASGAERLIAASGAGGGSAARAPEPQAQPAEAPRQIQPARQQEAAEAARPAEPRAPEPPRQIQPRAVQAPAPQAPAQPAQDDLPAAWQTQDQVAAEREAREGNRVSRFFGNMADKVRGWTGRNDPAEEAAAAGWAATVKPAEPPRRVAQRAPEQQPPPQQQQSAPQQQAAPSPQPAQRPQQAQQQVARVEAPEPPKPAEPPAVRAPQAAEQPQAQAAAAEGFLLQLASVRTEEEAKAAWAKLSAQNQQLIGGRKPVFKQAELGSLGTFYRIQIGPFQDKAVSLRLCDALKRQGVDCFLVTR